MHENNFYEISVAVKICNTFAYLYYIVYDTASRYDDYNKIVNNNNIVSQCLA